MNIVRWSEDKIRKMNMWDMTLVKFVCTLFGVILGAYISGFVREYIWIFFILFLAGYITAIYRFFCKK